MRPRNAVERAVTVLLVTLSIATLLSVLLSATNTLLGVAIICGYWLLYAITWIVRANMPPRNAFEWMVGSVLVLLSFLTFLYTLVTSTNPLLGVLALLGFWLVYGFTRAYGDLLSAPASRAESAIADGDDPIEILRRRYARGEIDEREFERAIQRLQETAPGRDERKSDSRPATDEELLGDIVE